MCSAISLIAATISRRCSSKNFAFIKRPPWPDAHRAANAADRSAGAGPRAREMERPRKEILGRLSIVVDSKWTQKVAGSGCKQDWYVGVFQNVSGRPAEYHLSQSTLRVGALN
jgi:hypothetical protein